jgi:KDO2-lipid IV(A) lauroyltransferase
MSGPRDPVGLRALYLLMGFAAWVAYRLLGLRRAVIRGNLQRSFPDWTLQRIRQVEREFARRQGETLAELLYARRLDADAVRERVLIANPESLADAAPGRTVILAAAHHNNFEWALQRVSLDFGARLYGLYKPIRNARVDAWFRSMRQRFGSQLIPAKSVLRVLARNRDCAVLGIVADQAPTTSRQKYWTTLLGQDTAFYMGPELLARPLRAQLQYTRVRRLARGRYEVSFAPLHERGESLPQGEITERYARALEAEIRADPAGWWWSHKRWKLKREPASPPGASPAGSPSGSRTAR